MDGATLRNIACNKVADMSTPNTHCQIPFHHSSNGEVLHVMFHVHDVEPSVRALCLTVLQYGSIHFSGIIFLKKSKNILSLFLYNQKFTG